jgi:thioredoxin reductase
MESSTPTYDVIVIGGGAAGLSSALTLARARRSVLVIDAGSPRNAPASHVHNYLGREGTPPLDLLAAGRDEVARFGGEVVDGEITAARPLDGGGFEVTRRPGTPVLARRLVVTTGLADQLPDIPGLAERWGRDVLQCPYCHGWEVRDEPVAVVATSPLAVHQALLWRQWTAHVTVVLHDAPAPAGDEAKQLAARGIAVVAGPVAAVEGAAGAVTGLRLHDGGTVPCRRVVVAPRFAARAGFLADLRLPVADYRMGDQVLGTHVPTGDGGATAVPGVWAAGNVTDPTTPVIAAAAAGLAVAHAVNLDLVLEDTRAAMA